MNTLSGLDLLFELSSIASIIALGMRNQLYLRTVLLAVYALHMLDEIAIAAPPNFEHLAWYVVFLLFNGYVLAELAYGRTTLGLTDDEKELFTLFVTLSPGEFRKLIHLATWRTAEEITTLTTEGVTPDRLFYIYEGRITISKADRAIAINPLTFIGEIAFLRAGPASASVTVSPGARWIEWPVSRLRRHLARDTALRVGFNRLIGEDLAQKVARA